MGLEAWGAYFDMAVGQTQETVGRAGLCGSSCWGFVRRVDRWWNIAIEAKQRIKPYYSLTCRLRGLGRRKQWMVEVLGFGEWGQRMLLPNHRCRSIDVVMRVCHFT